MKPALIWKAPLCCLTKFNANAEEQKNYITDEAKYWATAPIEENEAGSAKYWASQAKINYEEALLLADTLNGEEI